MRPGVVLLGADGVRNLYAVPRNADTIIEAGCYTLTGASINIPESAQCILVVKNLNSFDEQASNEVSQTIYYRANGQIYHRTRHEGAWSSWVRVDNFGCNTLDALASALGVLGGQYEAYQIAVGEQGFPSSYGLHVIIRHNTYYLHLFSDMQSSGVGNNLYWAHTTSRSVPTSWHQIQNVG